VGAASLVGLLALTGSLDLRVARSLIPTGDMIGIFAAGVCCVGLTWGLGVSLVRTFQPGILREVVQRTTRISSLIFVIIIGAQLFSLVFRGLGGDELVRDFLIDLPGGALGAMVAVMALMFIMGFFLDFIEITFVVVPIIAPVLLQMGLDPVWLGVMIAVNLQTSFLTPPLGFALFYLRGVAPREVTTQQIYKGVIPFVIIQLIALMVLALFPEIATWLPHLIFG
jgi:TRAP-type mannitol/chloroaromatic compound transport system permease large subunit